MWRIYKEKEITMELKFGDIKKMDYDDRLPFELVLVDLLYKKQINVNEVLECYTEALDKERHLNAMRFEEACTNLTQMLSKNFKKKEDKENMYKRAIHTFNLSNSLPKHIYDTEYGYTEQDEKEWDDFCKSMYGTNLKGE